MTNLKLLAAVCMSVTVALTAGSASAYSGENLAPQAKVSLVQARAIALKAFPGKITDEELETEGGGSGLQIGRAHV